MLFKIFLKFQDVLEINLLNEMHEIEEWEGSYIQLSIFLSYLNLLDFDEIWCNACTFK